MTAKTGRARRSESMGKGKAWDDNNDEINKNSKDGKRQGWKAAMSVDGIENGMN